jgi:hypothetical protein
MYLRIKKYEKFSKYGKNGVTILLKNLKKSKAKLNKIKNLKKQGRASQKAVDLAMKTAEEMGSDPDIPNRDKNCVNKSEVRPRYY